MITMNDTFRDIEKLEAADNLRANSKLTSSDYFLPVLGVIFLRHAANRFDAATKLIADDKAAGKMPKRKVLPADYLRRRALWLPEAARYDTIMHKASSDVGGLPRQHKQGRSRAVKAGQPIAAGVASRASRAGAELDKEHAYASRGENVHPRRHPAIPPSTAIYRPGC
jgi:hypothetical protein